MARNHQEERTGIVRDQTPGPAHVVTPMPCETEPHLAVRKIVRVKRRQILNDIKGTENGKNGKKSSSRFGKGFLKIHFSKSFRT